jgi:hypothetical protein
MIKLKDILNEGTAAPGALEGWLDPMGVCHYVKDDHPTWAVGYLKMPVPVESPNPKDFGKYEAERINLKNILYQKGWVRIAILHDKNIIYFDTFDTKWTQCSRAQHKWLQAAAAHGIKIHGDKIMIGDKTDIRHPPYKLQFGNTGEYIPFIDLSESKI